MNLYSKKDLESELNVFLFLSYSRSYAKSMLSFTCINDAPLYTVAG